MYGGNYRTSGGFRPTRTGGGDTPLTYAIIGMNILTFLTGFFLMRAAVNPLEYLVFSDASLPRFPWTLLTWPLVSGLDIFSLVFGALWMFWVSSSLERAWGTRTYAGFLAATSVLTGLSVWLGSLLLKTPFLLLGLWLASAAPTVAWCRINRRETVVMSFFFPVPAPILGWITLAFTWFGVSMNSGHPLLGLFATAGGFAAWWWVDRGREMMRRRPAGGGNLRFDNFGSETEDGGAGNPIIRWKRDREKKKRDQKLEEMFKRSGYDGDERN